MILPILLSTIISSNIYFNPVVQKDYVGFKFTESITNSIWFKIRIGQVRNDNFQTYSDTKIRTWLEFDF